MYSDKSTAPLALAAVLVTACIGVAVALVRPFSSDSSNEKQQINSKSAQSRTASSRSNNASTPSQPTPAAAVAPKAPVTNRNSERSVPKEPEPAKAPSVTATGGAAVLARLRQQREASAAAAKQKAAEDAARSPVAILYASQTGTAEEIARSLYDEALQKGLKADAASMNDWKFSNINPSKSPVLIVIAASTGDGDPPDNSAKCILALKTAPISGQLKGVRFTVLGLGDSNYTRFMEVPRLIKRKLLELGAEELYKSAEADEVEGLEDIVDAWRDGLWGPVLEAAAPKMEPEVTSEPAGKSAADLPADYTKDGGLLDVEYALSGVPALRASRVDIKLSPQIHGASDGGKGDECFRRPTAEQLAYRDDTGHYSEEKPFWATLKEVQLLTSDACPHEKRVLHVVFDVSGSGMKFQAGDAFTVHPSNHPALVEALLKHLGEDGNRTLDSIAWTEDTADSTPLPHLHLHETIKHNLLWSCELTHPPTKALLVALAEHTSDAREAHTLRFLASRDGRGAYQEDIIKGRPDLLQLLQRYPTCRPPISRLLELLGPLRPRQYSLANSAATAPELLECAFKVVEYTTHWGPHQGVATTWLEREVGRCGGPEGVYYPVSLRPTTGFRPPKDSTVPLIMVGPGTGVAPFRGFLQERRARAAKGAKLGESWLFFGNWREDWDFLFEEAFRGFAADGTLSHLCLAWSRTSEKVYVQHKMKEQGASLCEALLERGGYLFVCGDGLGMASDVHSTIKGILQAHGDMDASKADDVLRDLAAEKRYLKDVWI